MHGKMTHGLSMTFLWHVEFSSKVGFSCQVTGVIAVRLGIPELRDFGHPSFSEPMMDRNLTCRACRVSGFWTHTQLEDPERYDSHGIDGFQRMNSDEH